MTMVDNIGITSAIKTINDFLMSKAVYVTHRRIALRDIS